ncbi:MAG TPA: guanine deaminase, partial [Casimicrobiaceae bacterium]|nr:guanine deaminase [Casimicrobiaceae bacterium]
MPASSQAPAVVLRGGLLWFRADPFLTGVDAARVYESDGAVAMQDGKVIASGSAADVLARVSPDSEVLRFESSLITAGFIDCHVHYPQLSIIGAGGKALLDWLDLYTFPAEEGYADPDLARAVASLYLAENLRHGITSAAVFGTVHPHSVDVLFEQALALRMRLIAGKVLMDRHAPAALLDTAQRGYDESKALIARWHGRDRLAYAITPRFAATSTPQQLEAAGALWRECPGTYVQSHVAENRAELDWIHALFPEHARYVDVYAHYGLLGRRATYAHGIHLDEQELQALHATGTAIAHCPTSNNFLGSGQFDLSRARSAKRPVRVGLGTDLGAGTHFSMLRTMQAASEVAHLR